MIMSKVLKELSESDDPVARDLARALSAWQQAKESRGLPRFLGYEPRDIVEHGAVYVIETRIRNSSRAYPY